MISFDCQSDVDEIEEEEKTVATHSIGNWIDKAQTLINIILFLHRRADVDFIVQRHKLCFRRISSGIFYKQLVSLSLNQFIYA